MQPVPAASARRAEPTTTAIGCGRRKPLRDSPLLVPGGVGSASVSAGNSGSCTLLAGRCLGGASASSFSFRGGLYVTTLSAGPSGEPRTNCGLSTSWSACSSLPFNMMRNSCVNDRNDTVSFLYDLRNADARYERNGIVLFTGLC